MLTYSLLSSKTRKVQIYSSYSFIYTQDKATPLYHLQGRSFPSQLWEWYLLWCSSQPAQLGAISQS